MEFERDGVRYLVAVKSGPNWANSQQIARMRDNFRSAGKVLRTSGAKIAIRAVNGCCYGKVANEDCGDYLKLCGQAFWAFVSGSELLYIDIIEPLGHDARARNEAFDREYARVITRMTRDIISDFCTNSGAIAWPDLLRFTCARVQSKSHNAKTP